MRRPLLIATHVAFTMGCMRGELAYVKVADPKAVVIVTNEIQVMPDVTPGVYLTQRPMLFTEETMERKDDGSIVFHSPIGSDTPPLVAADGSLVPFGVDLLPNDRSYIFMTIRQRREWPRHGRSFFEDFRFVTPWSNVRGGTIKKQTFVVPAIVELAVGAAATFLGVLVLADARHEDDHPASLIATGIGLPPWDWFSTSPRSARC
jgi:hypothetical protein